MRYLKQLLDFYINSSIHIGLALFSLTYVTTLSNDLCKHITYPCCVFFGTIIGYNFLKYFEVFQKGNFSLKKYFWILVVTLLAVFGYLFFVIRMVDSIKIQLLIAAGMVLVYPFLRKFGVIKMFWVSFVIAYLTAFVFINALPGFEGNIGLEFFKRFVFVSALMIPFEIYDSQHDDKTLNTLPQKLGIANAKKVGYLLLLLFVVLEILNFNSNDNDKIQYLVIAIVIAIFVAIALRFSTLERSKYYTSFWAESIPILWFALLLAFS
ncbi:hypothetical protein [Flavobacterium terrisoli]|uniref:hypothetical protein n=1 Tax=Flavobacterium terrisoli TaxID=3242195 RepID=UPI002542E4A7|nr:hypothetical protein [Flavobacterium buctense]